MKPEINKENNGEPPWLFDEFSDDFVMNFHSF